MKPSRPQSFAVGPYTIREDAGAAQGADGRRVARVFTGSVSIFHGTLNEAWNFALERVNALPVPLDELTPEHITCPRCDGPGEPLGQLGSRLHVRCRNCGADYSRDVA